MVLNGQNLHKAEDIEDMAGIRMSAGLLLGLGCLWGFYAVFFIVLEVAGPRNARWSMRSVFTECGLILLCWLCVQAAKALRKTRRWGAYVAIAFGVLLLLFAGSIINDMYHPERQVNDEGYVLLLVPFIAGVGLWWCVYVHLPRVRTRFASNDSPR